MAELSRRLIVTFLLVAAGVFAGNAVAADIPDVLKPWQGWVLHGQEEEFCPGVQGRDVKPCVWPGRLTLEIGQGGGTFELLVETFAPSWVGLPGDVRIWPQQVRSASGPLAVMEREGLPRVFLETGRYRVRGEFSWSQIPDMLALPNSLALVDLTLRGEQVDTPDRDEQGRLWLKRRQVQRSLQQEALRVEVFRRLVDDVPFQVESKIELQVSGSPREVTLGGGLLPGAQALSVNSPLPARLEEDGRLRLQLRPGTWWLTLNSRLESQPESLNLADFDGVWSDEEIWVFEARPELRLVELSGVPLIDPQQTRLPHEWRQLPTYRMSGSLQLSFEEKRRGSKGELKDRLSLQRTLWLDFDGGGYTIQDHVKGTMGKSWRLELPSPGELGRVALDGRNQYITRVTEQGPAGIEVRRGQVDLTADSRWLGSRSTLSAVGWSSVFQNVSASLNLPPGWMLLDISGADHAPGTWLKQWSLLDLFLVLLVAIGAFRLWGWRWGGVVLIAIGLAWHEPGAPRWVWLHLLAAAALLRVLPDGKARVWIGWYRSLTYLALVAIALVFMVSQVRIGLYPQLARPGEVSKAQVRHVMKAKAPQPQSIALEDRATESIALSASSKRISEPAPVRVQESVVQQDPQLQLQTGPGLPQWQWQKVQLNWNGPVGPQQRLRLLLLPPWMSFILCLVRVVLVGLLLWRVLDLEEPDGGWRSWLRPVGKAAVTASLLAALLPVSAAQADYPSEALLKQLEQRLLEEPACGTNCASIGRMHLNVDQRKLQIRLLVDAQAEVAIPLPGQSSQWSASEVILDGKKVSALRREREGVWVVVPEGRHQVVVRGTVPRVNNLLLPLPLRPHEVSWHVEGWQISGIDSSGRPEAQLQLQREELAEVSVTEVLEPGRIEPFARIERTLHIGLEWQVSTRVVKLSPHDHPMSLDVPLLADESPIDEVQISDAREVRVDLPAGVSQRGWRSFLSEQPRIVLLAAVDRPWVEIWKLDVSPLWHVEFEGIPNIYPQNMEQRYFPEWRPWPGEQLTLALQRPQGIPGQTLTIDDTRLTLSPGERSTDATLEIEIRSSQGDQHKLVLPPESELIKAVIDEREQPLRREGDAVVLPLHPGKQNVALTLRLKGGMTSLWETPDFSLESPSVNSRIDVKVPADRWVLFAGGPDMGPAVLFWGVVIIVIATGLVLARIPLAPVRNWEWILLGLGLTQVHVVLVLLVVGWLLALGWRRRIEADIRAEWFNLTQVGLVLLTVLALGAICWSVQFGLLGYPDMQISGNGSSSRLLRWYQDISPAAFPQAWVVSLPMLVYRLAMLAWSLWLAFTLLRWLTWGWEAFSTHGLWRHRLRKGKFRFLSAEGEELDDENPRQD